MDVRITTFNCENLFGRYAFLDMPPTQRKGAYEKLIQINEIVAFAPGRGKGIKPKEIGEAQRKNTAAAVLAAKPDILVVAEVENLITLRLFNGRYLKNYFDRVLLIDGNDPRGIDVGLLLRRGFPGELLDSRSHADEAKGGGTLPSTNRLDAKNCLGHAIFSRDCLEADIKIGNRTITLLANHFKAQDGKPASTAKRIVQAQRVTAIAAECVQHGTHPIVLGDLNIDQKQQNYDHSLDALLASQDLSDPFAGLANASRWTHFYASDKSVSKLDYILVHKAIANTVKGTEIFRGGLSPNCKQYTGPRIGTVATQKDVEASDHCPVTVVMDL